LRADKTNEANLDAIERCMLVLCLDGATPPPTTLHCHSPEGDCAATRDEVSLAEQMIHGHGSSVNSANRWFEKTMQVNERDRNSLGMSVSCGICGKYAEITELYMLWSELTQLSRRKLSQTLASAQYSILPL